MPKKTQGAALDHYNNINFLFFTLIFQQNLKINIFSVYNNVDFNPRLSVFK